MKHKIVILISGLLFSGCSDQHGGSTSAIDRIRAGADTTWNAGTYILHVEKREGDSVTGVRITSTSQNGQKATTSAETGKLLCGTTENPGDQNSVRIVLLGAAHQGAAFSMRADNMIIELHQ